jgi:GT2 family glycosyltransferase
VTVSTRPATSFVVTCHDLGRFLDEAVDSLLAQTVQDFEIVVVNDGSTDPATCRLLADYRRDRTRVVHSERRGLPGARNLGVAHSVGRYLCMVDADDRLEPVYLERSLEALDGRPDLAFASHWLRAFGDESWEWTPTDCTFPALLHANTLNGAALLRREVFEQAGGFDEAFTDGCEDWEFWIRVVAAGHRGTIIPEFLFQYRRRSDSMSRRMHGVPGMAALHRQLMARHAEVFARHLDSLLESRDSEIASLSTRLWRLEREWVAEVEPRRRWERDTARATRDGAVAAAHATARDAQIAHLDAEVRRLDAAFNREAGVNAALRSSWSWRLTAPLRAALRWTRR